jgi:uncharacterized protein (DUF1330 family)
MIYYTQLIFVKPGREEAFQYFEARVLPLLDKYGGELLLRVRPQPDDYIAGTLRPYEIHLVTFDNRESLEAYSNDPERIRVLALKEESIEKAMLVEGNLL